MKISWPEGKAFAFAVFDDTDRATLENIGPVYAFLKDCGLRTTKSVWPIHGRQKPVIGRGATCEDEEYLEWIQRLQSAGFEIGFHNAMFHSSLREETIRGVERFYKLFGHYPYCMANHSGCQESIYWGNYRLTGLNQLVYNLITRFKNHNLFRGHIKGDKYFWGDICKLRIKYVRNFVFDDINTLKACPIMPYYDSARPYVNYWFASSEAGNVNSFNALMSEQNQDRLEKEGGACIVYTHFAAGFCDQGDINITFRRLMEHLSHKNAWFVPVSSLLDYILEVRGHHTITDKERCSLERKWLWHKVRVGTS